MTPEKMTLRKAYDLGRLRAMRAFLDHVRRNGGDIALVKVAHDVLMYDNSDQSAKWIMEQYTSIPPRPGAMVEVVDPKTGVVDFLVDAKGAKFLSHNPPFPEPFLSCLRPVDHPCS